ncbi:MAG TPA: DUF2279 domain-containing protein [Chitinophagaceae bacterium]|nr:DUF2279 domain-containing protein [Chitinophagaceae bacterium]
MLLWLIPASLTAQPGLPSTDGDPGSGSIFRMTRSLPEIDSSGPVPSVPTPDAKRDRELLVGGVSLAGYGGSLLILNQAWYANYPRSSFHTFNDVGEWLQMDKAGHGWTAYNTGRLTSAMWRWAGVPRKEAALLGGVSGTLYMTVIEFLDGHSAQWGWSWGDMAANVSGSSIFIAQEMAWGEQRIQYKFSFHRMDYHDPVLESRANDLFGKSWYERMLKDYNAQTYWLSANLRSFFQNSSLPPWLNVAAGYGADGMFGGFDNTSRDAAGNLTFDRRDIPRIRQFYLAPDIDFTKIPTRKKWVRTVLAALNAFKCPAPAIMLDGRGRLRFYAFYF